MVLNKIVAFLVFFCFIISCNTNNENTSSGADCEKIQAQLLETLRKKRDTIHSKQFYSVWELSFIKQGLVDIQNIDTTIHIDLRYSSTNNFLGKDVYGDVKRAYLQPDVAGKLSNAQQFLKQIHPEYSLLVFDAVRPLAIQQMMWDTIKMLGADKLKYLTNPKYGSIHNYGAAVDISIIDSAGAELDMGTPFDFFDELAQPSMEITMKNRGKLSDLHLKNRQLLRSVMSRAGFFNIETEWWHFNYCTREKASVLYKIIP